jgi:hypothetical protein
MRKSWVLLLALLLVIPAAAQQRAGNIYGKIVDPERNPLPGVTVTLSGPQMAPMTTVTSEVGLYRFPSISPGNQYVVKAELQGFKTITQGNVIVSIGGNSEINVTMEVGKLEEQVTVTAATPIVDIKKTTVGQMVDKETLQSLPTARDPWVVMQLAPAVMVDRENVGGNESGQQSGFIGKGDTSGTRISGNQGANNIWAIDGIDVTDPAALGGSANYYDFDMFEELNVQTGGAADVSIQTGGIAINMVSRRGGNKLTLAGRFYLTDQNLQSSNLTQGLKNQGVLDTNKIKQIKDYGFQIGGPFFKDKLWFWGAYGIQDIFNFTLPTRVSATQITPPAEYKALLANYNFKLNAQLLANNRFEALVTSGNKEMFGRDASSERIGGNHQVANHAWGSPIIKLQDEHVFGNNLYAAVKYSYNNAGFKWRPVSDESLQYPIVYDEGLLQFVPYMTGMRASWDSYGVDRPRNNLQFNASYFNDTFLGMSHEIKIGTEYSHKVQSTVGSNTGNIQGFTLRRDYTSLNLDVNADGTRTVAEMAGWQRASIFRRSGSFSVAQQWAAYIQDTITKGRFTLTLGLRFDKQWSGGGAFTNDAVAAVRDTTAWGSVFDTTVSDILAAHLTPISIHSVKGIPQIVNGADRPYQWNTFSPRIGLTWDISGDGKTVAKLALSQYGDIMGVGWYANTPFGTGGTMNFWWNDVNHDNKMTFNEMYWAYSSRQAVGTRYVPYQVFADATGTLTPAATAMLAGGYNSDAYYGSQYSGYDFLNPDTAPDYAHPTTYFLNRAAQSSARTREILLTLEREILPNFSASANFTYRRFDNNQIGLNYYPTEHADEYPAYTGPEVIDPRTPPAGGWYVQAGTIPDNYIIGGTWTLVNGVYVNTGGTTYSSGHAAGLPYYLPGLAWPTTSTRYTVIRKNDAYFTYTGVDLVLNKRLSNRWFMDASFTWQDQRTYWGKDYFNATNKWAFDGKAYGDWGGAASGKVAVLMYTRWMVKVSGLYQLPWGIDISGTFNAREGWKIPQYLYIDNANAPNYAAGHATIVYKQPYTQDHLPTFYNITLRLEKKLTVGSGRAYLMVDVFNLLNSNMPIRSYSKYDGYDYVRDVNGVSTQYSSYQYPFNGLLNEVLNPRIWRFGVRFEF